MIKSVIRGVLSGLFLCFVVWAVYMIVFLAPYIVAIPALALIVVWVRRQGR